MYHIKKIARKSKLNMLQCDSYILLKTTGEAVYTDSFVLFTKTFEGAEHLKHDVLINVHELESKRMKRSPFTKSRVLAYVQNAASDSIVLEVEGKTGRKEQYTLKCYDRTTQNYPRIEVLETKPGKLLVSLSVTTLEKLLAELKERDIWRLDLCEGPLRAYVEKNTNSLIMSLND